MMTAIQLVFSPYAQANDEYFGDTTSSVGSISLNIFSSPAEREIDRRLALTKIPLAVDSKSPSGEAAGTPSPSDFDKVLKLIPSWKYYKIIANEYSRRSTDYTGEENLLAPLL